jgi:hypothetical protein
VNLQVYFVVGAAIAKSFTPKVLRRACRNTFGVNETQAVKTQGSSAAPNNPGLQGVTPSAY